MPSLTSIAALILGLVLIEGTSYWWMHPASAGLGQPVLVYRPQARQSRPIVTKGEQSLGNSGDRDQRLEIGKKTSEIEDKGLETGDQKEVNASAHNASSPSTLNPQLSTSSTSSLSILNHQLSTSSLTPLPEIYAKAAPMLRCTGGLVNYLKLTETSGIHLAFFEWDGTDTGSVLEAFRHMPEVCMGSIGMVLVSKEKPISYAVDGETLLFDHTVFREPSQGGGGLVATPLIHAFRAVWVAGVTHADAREGLAGDDFDRLRTIRLKSAINRFRPAHARVIQGAVRGLSNPDLAWEAFENTMLVDLKMER